MKKVGIVTLSASDNCGSLLQAYALQNYIEEAFGLKVEIINLKTKQSDDVYALFTKDFYKHPKKTLFTLNHLFSIIKQKHGYSDFRQRYLHLSNEIFRKVDDIAKIVDDYDYLITGSDQVWNVYMSDYDDSFYLPWKTRAKKLSYAASLGSTQIIDPLKRSQLKEWLADYCAISVREETGRKTIQALTDKKVYVTVDPTLLLSEGQWSRIVGERMIKKPYIFFYSWAYPDENMNRLVQRFSQEKGLDVYVINSSKWYRYRPGFFNFKLYPDSGPNVFLNLMKNAEYVFVQSFHGTVFANIFHKRFFFLSENGKDKVDFRSKNLLDLLDENSQVVSCYNDISKGLNSNLSYKSPKLDEIIMGSKEYLKSALKG